MSYHKSFNICWTADCIFHKKTLPSFLPHNSIPYIFPPSHSVIAYFDSWYNIMPRLLRCGIKFSVSLCAPQGNKLWSHPVRTQDHRIKDGRWVVVIRVTRLYSLHIIKSYLFRSHRKKYGDSKIWNLFFIDGSLIPLGIRQKKATRRGHTATIWTLNWMGVRSFVNWGGRPEPNHNLIDSQQPPRLLHSPPHPHADCEMLIALVASRGIQIQHIPASI